MPSIYIAAAGVPSKHAYNILLSTTYFFHGFRAKSCSHLGAYLCVAMLFTGHESVGCADGRDHHSRGPNFTLLETPLAAQADIWAG